MLRAVLRLSLPLLALGLPAAPPPASGADSGRPNLLSLLYQPRPAYPRELRDQGVEGAALVDFTVAPDGKVRRAVAIAYTHPEFGEAAEANARGMRFRPALKDGQPVATEAQTPILFTLSPDHSLFDPFRSQVLRLEVSINREVRSRVQHLLAAGRTPGQPVNSADDLVWLQLSILGDGTLKTVPANRHLSAEDAALAAAVAAAVARMKAPPGFADMVVASHGIKVSFPSFEFLRSQLAPLAGH
jgi:TonB family protein